MFLKTDMATYLGGK